MSMEKNGKMNPTAKAVGTVAGDQNDGAAGRANEVHLIDLYRAKKMKYGTMMALMRKKLCTLQEVARCSKMQLSTIPGVGAKGMHDIEALMKEYGLVFMGKKYLE